MNIPDEQLAAALHGEPVKFEALGTIFVIVRSDVYDRLQAIHYDDGPLSEEERLAAIHAAGARADWHDPELDVYESERTEPGKPAIAFHPVPIRGEPLSETIRRERR